MHSCKNNPEKSYTEKKAEYETWGNSWSLICSFDATKNKHNFYRKKIVLKEKFCEDLKELAMDIINYKEK